MRNSQNNRLGRCTLILATWPTVLAGLGCTAGGPAADAGRGERSYADDIRFIKSHTRVIELKQGAGRIAVAPELQGRVMTSGFTGGSLSLGWVSRPAIEAGERDVPFNGYGGEDRFWLGPEGGQFTLFFDAGAEQDFDTWRVPDAMNKGPFEVVHADEASVCMRRSVSLTNASGTRFDVTVHRTIRPVGRADAAMYLDCIEVPADVSYVGFVSENGITNAGDQALTPEGGAVSIWNLGQFPGRDDIVVIAPYNTKGDGPVANSSYFEEPGPERMVIDTESGVVLFRGDSKARGKFALSPGRSRDRIASMDFENRVLTIVHFDRMQGETRYVNSLWHLPQEEPFAGDLIMSYNHHGEKGEVFHELETSSPAAFLAPGQSMAHHHRTLHFHGPMESLSKLSATALGVSLERVRARMP